MKKPIIIKEENTEKINAALDEVQHTCKARTIDANDIFDACKEVEEKLGITKVSMNGTRAIINVQHEIMPKAYGYRAESTHFVAEYKNRKWYLLNVCRDNVEIVRYRIKLSDEAKAALIEKFEYFNF